jgi:serine protease Do
VQRDIPRTYAMRTPYRFTTLAIICSMFAGVGLAKFSEYALPPARMLAAAPSTSVVLSQAESFRNAAKAATPSVVNITVLKRAEGGPDVPLDDLAFSFRVRSRQRSLEPQGIGSGVILDADNGYVLTNSHVAAAGTHWVVRLSDKREFEATLVGMDAQSDVAVLRINASRLQAARIGDSDHVEVGDWVLAVGNPFGLLEDSVTAGIISAKGRRGLGSQYEDYLQTDAAINMGNSGGPLVNLNGEVVGLNTAIMSSSGGYQGIGFALPINHVKAIAERLIHDGVVVRGWLDVRAKDTSLSGEEAVSLEGVHAQGPAHKAGLRSGDVVLKFNGKAVHTAFDLHELVSGSQPGKDVPIEISRGGARQVIQTTIGSQPDDSPSAGAL